jgi:hypothetical protein
MPNYDLFSLPLSLLYRDDLLVAVSKPSGLAVLVAGPDRRPDRGPRPPEAARLPRPPPRPRHQRRPPLRPRSRDRAPRPGAIHRRHRAQALSRPRPWHPAGARPHRPSHPALAARPPRPRRHRVPPPRHLRALRPPRRASTTASSATASASTASPSTPRSLRSTTPKTAGRCACSRRSPKIWRGRCGGWGWGPARQKPKQGHKGLQGQQGR